MSSLDQLAKRSGLKPDAVRELFKHMTAMLEEGQQVRIVGFGTFKSTTTKPRKMVSPVLPGGEAEIPAKRVIRFKMSPELRKAWTEGE